MDGDIVKPGDLHGRVLPADKVNLSWDGNLISAVVGRDLVVGVSGFGDAAHDALRELADHLIEEAVWVEITDAERIDPAKIRPCDNRTIQTSVVGLHRIEEGRISAVVAAEGSPFGVLGIGESVHEALRHLVRQGVWVEVTSRTEWHLEEISDVDSLPEELKAGDAPEGAAVKPGITAATVANLSRYITWSRRVYGLRVRLWETPAANRALRLSDLSWLRV